MIDEPQTGEDFGSDEPTRGEEYHVGYKRPPLHSRFRPGESGNRRGRPKGARNFRTILIDVAMRKTTVVRSGKSVRQTNLEHVVDAVRLRAAQGDPIALWLANRYGMPQPDEDEFKIPRGVLILGEKLTEEEWLEKCREFAEAQSDYPVPSLPGETTAVPDNPDATFVTTPRS